MFDIGWSELLVIGIVALVVIGPKELPTVLRKVGQGVGKLRRMAGDFQGQFNEALREAELSDLKDNVTGLKNDLGNLANDARNRIANAIPTNPLHDVEDALKAPTAPVERKDLPTADIEAQLPPPSELEPHPFETIEQEVRAAAENVTPAPAATAPATKPAEAKSADAKLVETKPADAKPAEAAAPKRATRRKAVPAAEPEVSTAVADLDGTPAAKPARAVPKPRIRPKAAPKVVTAASSDEATPARTPRPRITRKPSRSSGGDEGPAA